MGLVTEGFGKSPFCKTFHYFVIKWHKPVKIKTTLYQKGKIVSHLNKNELFGLLLNKHLLYNQEEPSHLDTERPPFAIKLIKHSRTL